MKRRYRPSARADGRGFVPLGFVDPRVDQCDEPGLRLLGTIADLQEHIRDVSAECVFVASTATSSGRLDQHLPILPHCRISRCGCRRTRRKC